MFLVTNLVCRLKISQTLKVQSMYLSMLSPNNSSPSSSSSSGPASPNSESSSNGGKSRPGLEVKGSPRADLDLCDGGLVTTENGSELSSCQNKCKNINTWENIPQPMSLPSINFLHLIGSEIQPGQTFARLLPARMPTHPNIG